MTLQARMAIAFAIGMSFFVYGDPLGRAAPAPAPEPANPTPQNTGEAGKEETVSDVPYAIDISGVGTVDVYESVNKNGRYYIAPQLRFTLLDPPQVARISGLSAQGQTECDFSIVMLAPNVRAQVAAKLSALKGQAIAVENVGNLRVYAILLDVAAAAVKNRFVIQSYKIDNPEYSQTMDAYVTLNADTAQQFADAVNNGDVTFNLSYVYKNINLDSRVEKLDLSLVKKSQTFQNS